MQVGEPPLLRRRDCRATLAMTLGDNRKTLRLTHTHFTSLPTGTAGSLVPALICHCEERPLIPSSSRDVAISLRLDTRRRTAVATATRLPRYARNDKVGTHEALPGSVENVATPSAKSRPLPAWKMARVRLKPRLQPQNPVYPVYPCKTRPASPGPAQGPAFVGAPVDGPLAGPQKTLRYRTAVGSPWMVAHRLDSGSGPK